MSAIRRNVGVITLFEEDLDQAKEFYTRVFGKAPDSADADSTQFQFENTFINLEKAPGGHGVIPPAAVADKGAGWRVVLTFWVDDADAACTELAERGVTLIDGPKDTSWGTRTAHFADPGGHIWEVAQDLDLQPGS